MKRIKINEKITQRGNNSLFYQIEVYDVLENNELRYNNNSDYYIQPYQRNEINDILHETSIFKMFKKIADNKENWNDEQCKEYCKKMNQTIEEIIKIEEIYLKKEK